MAERLAWLERAAAVPMVIALRQLSWLGIAVSATETAETELAAHVGAGAATAAVHHAPHHNPTAEMGRDLL